MTTEINIRSAVMGDVVAIARLISALGYPTATDDMRQRLEIILNNASFMTSVAERAARVVGVVGCRVSHIYEKNGLSGYIMALAVDESERRSGCGRRLMETAEQWVRQQGGVEMVINSGNHRTEAHAFYRARGYEATGQRFIKFFAPI